MTIYLNGEPTEIVREYPGRSWDDGDSLALCEGPGGRWALFEGRTGKWRARSEGDARRWLDARGYGVAVLR